MSSQTALERRVAAIEQRNARVEADKAWETSWTRRILIIVLTYVIIVLVFWSVKLPSPLTNAIIPSVAFFLSTLTVPLAKRLWLARR